MPTLGDIWAGRATWPGRPPPQQALDTPIQQSMLDEEGGPPQAQATIPRLPITTLGDLWEGRATRQPDGKIVRHEKTAPAAPTDADTVWDNAWNTFVSAGMGVTSGVEAVGALTELAFPETGKGWREAGTNATQELLKKTTKEWQEAVNRSWIDFSKEGAGADWRSWVHGIASNAPYFLGTAGVGEIAALGIRGARAALGATVKKTGREAGYAAAGAGFTAGEAAAGAGQAAEQAGLTDEQRLQAMQTAAGIAAVGGAITGRLTSKILGGVVPAGTGLKGRASSIGKRGALSAGAESIEESSGAFGTEVGKKTVGLDFDAGNIAEAAVGGAAIGGPLGVALSAPGARRLKQRQQDKVRADQAEQQAINAERDRLAAEQAAPQPMLALPAPQQQLGLPAPTPPGPAAVGRGTQINVPPTESMQSGLSPSGEAELAVGGQAFNEYASELDNTVTAHERELDRARKRIESTRGNKAKAVAAFKTAKRAYDFAVAQREAYQKKRASASDKMMEQPLPGFEEIGPTDPNVIKQLVEQEIDKELDEAFGPDTEEPPLLAKINESVKRSQQARAAALTRWSKRQAATTGPGQTITTAEPASFPAQPQVVRNAGSAEVAAIRARTSAKVQTTPQADPNVAMAGPTTAQAALLPEMPQVAQPPVQSAAQPAPATQGPAIVAPPPSPSVAVQLFTPKAPQPQSGGVTSAPSTVATDTDRQQLLAMAAQGSDPTTVVGSDPLAPVLPGIEQTLLAKTPKRKKALPKMTPRERLAFMLKDGPRGVDTILAGLQDSFSASQDNRAFKLIQKLRSAFPNSTKQPLKIVVENRKLSRGFQGLYDPKSDRIFIDLEQAEDTVNIVLHEAVHAATLYKIRSNTGLRKSLEDTMRKANNAWTEMGWQPEAQTMRGFGSVEEFISEALTNTSFADKLASLPESLAEFVNNRSIWSRFKSRLATAFGMPSDPNSNRLFNSLLELIPDGTFLQEGNRQEILTQLDNLGLSQPVASLASWYRAAQRNTVVQGATAGARGRVNAWSLQFRGPSQIEQSFGELSPTIGNYTRLLDEREGHVANLRSLASRIIGIGKQAYHQASNPELLDEVLVNSRYWSLHADKQMYDPANLAGIKQPGGAQLYNKLASQWAALSPLQQDFYRLVTFNSTAQRVRDMQQIMIWRLRARLDNATAELLERMITTLPVQSNAATGPAPSGIEIKYHRMPTAAELDTFINTLGLNPIKTKRVRADLLEVQKAFGKETGPYVPLRRVGSYYVYMTSPERVMQGVTQKQYDAMMAKNKLDEGGDLEILEEKYDAALQTYYLKMRNVVVGSVDTRQDADDLLADYKAGWNTRGLTIDKEKLALKQADVYQAAALQSANVEALRVSIKDDVTKMLGAGAGEHVSDRIMTYYLDKLPEGSVRKSQMRARKIAGASRDMMHVYATYVNGAAYFSGQMMYGAKLASAIGHDMDVAGKAMQAAGQYDQAEDLQKIQNHLKRADAAYDRLAAKDALQQDGAFLSMWRTIPQLTAAWLLTGPGTTLINAMQVWQVGFPLLGSKHGFARSAVTITKAYTDLFKPIAFETGREVGRAALGVPRTLKVGLSRKGFTPEIRNPSLPMFEQAADYLTDPGEKDHIKALALRKKIDFGLVADIQSISNRSSTKWMATQYMMDAAFIMPQASETMNRMVMGLSSYRLNKDTVTQGVMADPTITNKAEAIQQQLLDLAARDIDQSQWNYSAADRPAAFQHEYLRFATVFKTYPQRMLYSIMHNLVKSMKAKTPQERKIARKFVAGILATTFIGAGMLGWTTLDPFYVVAMALTWGLSDEDDPEQALRKAMQEWIDEDWQPLTELLLKGPLYAGNVVDASRMALPSLVPWQTIKKTATGPASVGTTLDTLVGEVVLGAPGSLIEQMTKAAKAMGEGNYATAAEQMTPKAFGINDTIRALNYANRGLVDIRGNEYMGPKEIGYADIIRRGLGFDPPEIASKKSARRAFFVADDNAKTEKSKLIADFKDAIENRDKDARRVAIQAMSAFNKKYPGYKITKESVKASVRRDRKEEYLVGEYGVAVRNKAQLRMLREIEARY